MSTAGKQAILLWLESWRNRERKEGGEAFSEFYKAHPDDPLIEHLSEYIRACVIDTWTIAETMRPRQSKIDAEAVEECVAEELPILLRKVVDLTETELETMIVGVANVIAHCSQTVLDAGGVDVIENARPQCYDEVVDKIAATLPKGPGVHHAKVLHDDWCNRLKDPPGDCNCEPVAEVEVEVEELGVQNLNLYRDDSLMALGKAAWDDTYRHGISDLQAKARIAKKLYESTAEYLEGGVETRTELLFRHFLAKWAQFAFQKLITTHTYAAALMCSDAPREVLSDLEISWKAFLVVVPDGLFDVVVNGIPISLRRIAVGIYDGGASIILYDPTASMVGETYLLSGTSKTIEGLLYSSEKEEEESGLNDTSRKLLLMAKRLVVGLLLAYANTGDHKTKTSGGSSKKASRKREEPLHRITFIGKPTKADCRPAVERFLNSAPGTGKAPTMQSLVRGHHKRQVIGTRGSGRKVIWVEPYWRGPEDAPILTRPKFLN